VNEALAAYEAERRPVVASTQRAAQASLEWFENLGQYADQDPHQFAFNIMTRSRRVTYDNLRLRDPEFVAEVDRWFAGENQGAEAAGPCPPMFQPFRLGRLELANRVIVSPMDM
jgi:anthraniloyl-CoA monooxygenase